MKKIILILIFTLLTSFTFGQTEKENLKTVSDSFEKNYNSDNFDAIFATFSTEM